MNALWLIAVFGSTLQEGDPEVYCKYVESVADSASAPMIVPELYTTIGIVPGPDVAVVGGALTQRARFLAGVHVSSSLMIEGITLRQRVAAECARYRALSRLTGFVVTNQEGLSLPALKAKAQVLDAALQQAKAITSDAQAAVKRGQATLSEAHATELRMQALFDLAAETHAQLDGLSQTPQEALPIDELLRERDQAEEKVERYEARIREAHAWDLSLRGGYEYLFGLPENPPVFGLATLTVNIGWLLQLGSDSDAIEARGVWARRQVGGVDQRVEQVRQRLRAVEQVEKRRLDETAAILEDIKSRIKLVSALSSDRARADRDYFWFDMVRLEAEHAYVRAHLAELATTLGSTP